MVTGPGGVGASVLAAAGALHRESRGRSPEPRSSSLLSDPDRHTLLITVDRLTPMPEVLGVFRLPGETVAVSAGVHLLVLDRLATVEQTWARFVEMLSSHDLRASAALPVLTTLADIDAAEVVALPGAEDFLLLRRIRDEAVSGRWQRIVVDLSGAGDPFALLRSAAVLGQSLERLWPRHRRLAAVGDRPVLAQFTSAVDAIATDCADVAELFADAHVVAGHVVVGADARGRRLIEHYLAVADLMGFPVRSVLVNDGVAAVPEPFAVLDDAVLDDAVVAHIETAPLPLDRPARLRKLNVALVEPDGVARGSAAARVVAMGGQGLDARFELTWQQRLPDPQQLELGRSDDDLLVTVDGVRHAVGLPAILRRCTVVDAHWDGHLIHVEFVPNRAVWPK